MISRLVNGTVLFFSCECDVEFVTRHVEWQFRFRALYFRFWKSISGLREISCSGSGKIFSVGDRHFMTWKSVSGSGKVPFPVGKGVFYFKRVFHVSERYFLDMYFQFYKNISDSGKFFDVPEKHFQLWHGIFFYGVTKKCFRFKNA